jgi:hypothetical protein
MGNSNSAGVLLTILMIVGTIASWVGSGIVAWDWVEPAGFGEAVIFVIVWGIMGKVFDFVIGLVLAGIASLFD